MKRRSFLQTLGTLPLILAPKRSDASSSTFVNEVLGAGTESLRQKVLGDPLFLKNQAPILQGMTTESSSQFVVLRPRDARWRYEVSSGKDKKISIENLRTHARSYSQWCLDRFSVEGLQPDTDYNLAVLDIDTGGAVDERVFSALDRSANTMRFAMVSCMNDEHHESQMAGWATLIEEKPSILFYIGDTVYADKGAGQTEEAIWNKYVETRTLLRIFRVDRLIPSLAVWDDHDYGLNDSDGSYHLKEKTIKIFNAFFGSDEREGFSHGPGVSKVFEGYDQRVIMMDDRYFRAAKFSSGSPWGAEQEEWLLRHLSHSDKPTWIFNGGQFFGGYRWKDSYEFAHNKSFWQTMNKIAATGTTIVLGSGDVHFSEIMEIEPSVFGYKTYEITSSSMHSSTHLMKDKLAYNKRRVVSAWKHNFLIVESRAEGRNLKIDVRCLSGGGIENFRHSVQVERAN